MQNKRFEVMRGEVLSTDLDDKLQTIVSAASKISGFPVSLITIVLKRTQFFRAHVGLGKDLEMLRSTDSCSSFCQYVVSTKKPLKIKDAKKEHALPQQLVELYGIRAYHGFPVTIDGEVMGALCIIDSKPNEIDEKTTEALLKLASDASARLTAISDQKPWLAFQEDRHEDERKIWDDISSARQEMKMAMLGLYPVVKNHTESRNFSDEVSDQQRKEMVIKDAANSFGDLQKALIQMEGLLSKLKRQQRA